MKTALCQYIRENKSENEVTTTRKMERVIVKMHFFNNDTEHISDSYKAKFIDDIFSFDLVKTPNIMPYQRVIQTEVRFEVGVRNALEAIYIYES